MIDYDYMRIGKLAKMIQELIKATSNSLNTPISKELKSQVNILEKLNIILGFEENSYLSIFDFDKASDIFKGKKDLRADAVEVLQKLELGTAVANCKSKLQEIFPGDVFFIKEQLCKQILEAFSMPTEALSLYRQNEFQQDYHLEMNRLEEYYKEESYDEFIAYIIYYLATYVKNRIVMPEEMKQLLNTVNNIGQDTKDFIVSKRYYEDLDRRVTIIPHQNLGLFEIITTVTYTSPCINPVTSEKNSWSFTGKFLSERLKNNHSIESIHINEIDYTKQIQIEEFIDNDSLYTFRKKYSVIGIPYKESYNVSIKYRSFRTINYFEVAHRLKAPCLDYRMSINIRGEATNKFSLGFQMFSPYIAQESPNTLVRQVHGGVVSLHIPQLLPINSGHMYNIRPKREYRAELCSIEELEQAIKKLQDQKIATLSSISETEMNVNDENYSKNQIN